MKKLATAISVIALIGTPALAADLGRPAYKAPPPAPAPVFSWTGFYVGLNAGGAWARSDVTYVPPGLPFTGVVPAYSAIGSGTIDTSGFTGGGQAGYNWQFGLAVVGVEGDFNAFDLRHGFTNVGTPPGNVQLTSNASIQTDWLATARGRLGWAIFDRGLIYVTGGGAWTNVKFNQSNTYATPIIPTENFNSSTTLSGWTIGGGFEYAFAPNLSAKVEYLHLDFNGNVSGQTALTPVGFPTQLHSHSADLKDANLARVGINYRWF